MAGLAVTWSAQRPDFENPDVGTTGFYADTLKNGDYDIWRKVDAARNHDVKQNKPDAGR